ncbi:MAG: hypothetical protein J5606_06430 [Bacteroidales bacterium]|nr:hypothetical protein [Bacteroidales bacterium]
MKKLLNKLGVLSMGMAVSFVMFSCSSVDGLLDDYEKACKKGDVEKMAKIEKKLKDKELTKEQKKRVSEIYWNCSSDMLNEASKSASSEWENDDDDYDNDDDF